MGVGSWGQGGHGPPWIFIHGTNIVERALKVLFLAIFWSFLRWPPLEEAK